jgi:putative membrane protein insertion efficiency factor
MSGTLSMLQLAPRRLLMGAVHGYRLLLRPWVGNRCRFEPTCSAYALQALQRHGAWRGTALAGWRVLRCQPWCQGGCDPVPDTPSLRFPTAAGRFTRLGPRSPAPAPDPLPPRRTEP